MMKRIEVVAAIIHDAEGRIFASYDCYYALTHIYDFVLFD